MTGRTLSPTLRANSGARRSGPRQASRHVATGPAFGSAAGQPARGGGDQRSGPRQGPALGSCGRTGARVRGAEVGNVRPKESATSRRKESHRPRRSHPSQTWTQFHDREGSYPQNGDKSLRDHELRGSSVVAANHIHLRGPFRPALPSPASLSRAFTPASRDKAVIVGRNTRCWGCSGGPR